MQRTGRHTFRIIVTHALETFLAGIVDYAGLFPPAQLDMRSAVSAYADHVDGPHRAMLGRFVVPVARLREFDVQSAGVLPRGTDAEPWRLSALVGPDVVADVAQALAFNDRHSAGSEWGRAVIDSLEIKIISTAEIAAAMSRMPDSVRVYFELPTADDPRPLIEQVRRSGAMAKIRTGGVTADAFPSAEQIIRFIERCRDAEVAFKATAGLHHPIRGKYPLTYMDGSATTTMYGYLNIFLAAAFARVGAPTAFLLDLLRETDAMAITFDDAGVTYRDVTLSTTQLDAARRAAATSFGSCSFREPVEDLAALALL